MCLLPGWDACGIFCLKREINSISLRYCGFWCMKEGALIAPFQAANRCRAAGDALQKSAKQSFPEVSIESWSLECFSMVKTDRIHKSQLNSNHVRQYVAMCMWSIRCIDNSKSSSLLLRICTGGKSTISVVHIGLLVWSPCLTSQCRLLARIDEFP